MQEIFDVAVVGAGPAGISAACLLAGQGVNVLVLERGAYPGAKNVSGGLLYGHDLAQIIPDFVERGCPIERNLLETRFWYLSKEGGYSLSYRDRKFSAERHHNAFTIERVSFDRWFADQAEESGAQVRCSTVVTDLLRDERRRIVGVRTDGAAGDVRAKIVLLADGVNSPLAACTGFRPEVEPRDVSLMVKEVVELPQKLINERFNVDDSDGVAIDVFGAQSHGMNGRAAIYTNRGSLSLCIGVNLADLAKHKVSPYVMLESFKQHPMVAPLIKGAIPHEYTAHWRAEGGYDTIPQLCGDGFLIAGESAMLFNVLHREGINMAMTSGRFAAQAILHALQRDDCTCAGLRDYVLHLQQSYIFKDLRKYRMLHPFFQQHSEVFSELPELAAEAAREMLTVNGIPKQTKQHLIWQSLCQQISPFRLLRLLWKGWRTVH